MPSSYPGAADSFGAPAASDPQSTPVGGRTHSQSHTDLGDAVEAIEAELGLNPSGAAATVAARLDALDAAWPAADAAHVAAGDPHPQYETSAEATAKVSAHAGASDPHGDRAYAAALVDDLSGVTNASTARTNLGLGDAATKNVGTAAGTVAAGDDSRITGALPASLVDAKGDLIAASADNTPARLPVGAEGDVLTVRGSASSGLAWAQPQPRNLLTVNQSSVETDTTGWANYFNASVSRSTAQAASGTASLLITATGSTPSASTLSGTSGVPVVPGRLYTAHAAVYVGTATGRTARAGIRWYTAAGATIGSLVFGSTVTLTAGWQSVWAFEVAPATAAYAAVVVGSGSAVSGEDFYCDKVMLVEGYGGTWALGGQPIQGVGERWDETVGRRCFRWDWNNSREQMVYGDTGWRLCGEWDAAGNFTAGLQVSAFSAPWVSGASGKWYMRRIGYTVEHRIWGVQASVLASAAAIFGTGTSIPAGFQDGEYEQIPVATTVGSSFASIGCAASRNYLCGYASASLTINRSRVSYITDQVWPTTLPGTSAILPPSA